MEIITKLLIIGVILVGGGFLVIPIEASVPEPSFADILEQKINFIRVGIIDAGNSISESMLGIDLKF